MKSQVPRPTVHQPCSDRELLVVWPRPVQMNVLQFLSIATSFQLVDRDRLLSAEIKTRFWQSPSLGGRCLQLRGSVLVSKRCEAMRTAS
jgi:hypothetical protein